jgi:hypothetical protein
MRKGAPALSPEYRLQRSGPSRAKRNTFLVCYDICDDRRLARVYKTMRGSPWSIDRGLVKPRFCRAPGRRQGERAPR